jgi:hypothetical protein
MQRIHQARLPEGVAVENDAAETSSPYPITPPFGPAGIGETPSVGLKPQAAAGSYGGDRLTHHADQKRYKYPRDSPTADWPRHFIPLPSAAILSGQWTHRHLI